MARRAVQGQPDTKDTPDEVSGSVSLGLCSVIFVLLQAQEKFLC